MYLQVFPKVTDVFVLEYYLRLWFRAMRKFHSFQNVLSIPVISVFAFQHFIVLDIVNVVEFVFFNQKKSFFLLLRQALLQATGKSNKKTRKTKWHYLFSLFLFVIIIDAYI